jgi:hypothetical protein
MKTFFKWIPFIKPQNYSISYGNETLSTTHPFFPNEQFQPSAKCCALYNVHLDYNIVVLHLYLNL